MRASVCVPGLAAPRPLFLLQGCGQLVPVIRALLAGVGKTAGRVYPSQELHHQSSIFTGAAGLCAAELVSDASSAKAAAAAATSLLTLSEEASAPAAAGLSSLRRREAPRPPPPSAQVAAQQIAARLAAATAAAADAAAPGGAAAAPHAGGPDASTIAALAAAGLGEDGQPEVPLQLAPSFVEYLVDGMCSARKPGAAGRRAADTVAPLRGESQQ